MMPIIINYNRHEATKRLADWVGDCIVVDNGSDTPYPGAAVRLETNQETTAGIHAGLWEAKRQGARIYWLLSTSMEPDGDCNRDAILKAFTDPDVVGVSPLCIGDIKSPAHRQMTQTGPTKYLNTFSAWRAAWLDSIGWFDCRLTTGWGTDFETSYLARDWKMVIVDGVRLKIRETMHGDRTDFARQEMNTVLTEKYGDWRRVLNVPR